MLFRSNIVIGGLAQSVDFPLQNAAQSHSNAPLSGFVTRVVPGWYPITFLNGQWNLDTWHDTGNDGTSWTLTTKYFGQAGDKPIVGDWNGSGTTKIGVFRCGSTSCTWILDSNGNGKIDAADRQFQFGLPGDVPVVGDWDGTGYLKAGIFRNGYWILDLSGHMSGVSTGKPDATAWYGGLAGDVPVVGDWGSTGVTKIGVFRSGMWYLDANNNRTFDPPGDWSLGYGIAGDTPLVGDWDGSGTPKIGVSRGGNWMLNITGNNQYHAGIDTQFYYGNSSFMFAVGH